GLFLAYSNGANDNFKGVATLFGSGTADYRTALWWATGTTFAGSLAAMLLAGGLLAAFSGKGLLPAEIVSDPVFPAAVGTAAGLTVVLATLLGYPVSTTHGLIGGMLGAGLMIAGDQLHWAVLGQKLMLPLILSPLLAVSLTVAAYPLLRKLREKTGITHETCLCIGNEVILRTPGLPVSNSASFMFPSLLVDDAATCRVGYSGSVAGLEAGSMLDRLHFLSAGAVCFARGLNDTPKIAALLLAGRSLDTNLVLMTVGVLMAAGGVFSAARVADTMSHRISDMNPGQGLTANVVTALLVIFASKSGMPVSTTHVSCSALFGIGASTGQAHWKTIGQIGLAWLITLPVGMAFGALVITLLTAGF
ncbi:MAG: anion permease, partial [Pseudomonadales bacterium]|nr:anion permease [Pseudomonadales bacterium]